MRSRLKGLALLLGLVMLACTVIGPVLSVTAAVADLVDGANYMLVSAKNGKAMTVRDNSAENNVGICMMPAERYASQVWRLEKGADGYFVFVNAHSGKAMNVPGNAINNAGTAIIQWTKEGNNNEKWAITDTDDGYYRITPQGNDAFGLNINANSNADGASVIQWNYTGAENEKWRFVKVEQVLPNPVPELPNVTAAVDAWLDAFCSVDTGAFSNVSGFWAKAEMLEVVLDAYERLGDAKYKTAISAIFDRFLTDEGRDWSWNGFNDDVMWMVIASARAYLLTGEQKYLTAAKQNFDMCYNRAWDTTFLGGGLWWTTDNASKNACVNGPAAIAAYLLGEATDDPAYYDKAVAILDWEAANFLQESGAIWDSRNKDGSHSDWTSTYNQGTFIGACAMLYKHTNTQKYLDWATSAAGYAAEMGDAPDGYLNREQNSADLIGFKGILGRWLGYFARVCGVNTHNDWMYANAQAAWNNRNSDDLMWTQFGVQTQENLKTSQTVIGDNKTVAEFAAWGTSSAVSWLVNTPYTDLNAIGACYEMESGALAGGAALVANANASGGQHIGNVGGAVNGTISFEMDSTVTGTATLKIYYATAMARNLSVTVNDTVYTVNCPATGGWTTIGTPITLEVAVEKGSNTIRFGGVENAYAPNLDRFLLSALEEQAAPDVTPEPTPNAKAVIKAEDVTATAGSTVLVPVYLTNASALAAAQADGTVSGVQLMLRYDKAQLTLKKFEANGVFEAFECSATDYADGRGKLMAYASLNTDPVNISSITDTTPIGYIQFATSAALTTAQVQIEVQMVCDSGKNSTVPISYTNYIETEAFEVSKNPLEPLKFYSASVVFQTNLKINFKVKQSLFAQGSYTDPYVVFDFNGTQTRVSDYTVDGDKYVFSFANIGPHMLNDTISATLHANYNDQDCVSSAQNYSIATYCYNKLGQYNPTDNPERVEYLALMVDLLNYGAAAQKYRNYKTDALANTRLTAEQVTWGTTQEPELESVTNTAYAVVENPSVTWYSANLNYQSTVRLLFKFNADDIDGLSLRITTDDGKQWIIPAAQFEPDGTGQYKVLFNGLNSAQMRTPLNVTVCKGNTAVSNTLRYSIESYAFSKRNSTVQGLSDLVKAMINYGDSAYAYVY